jgi:uncharacterized protein (DUF111 family)
MLRVSLIDEAEQPADWSGEVVEIRAIIDDATPELLAAIRDALVREGARDAWLQATTMKKGRLGSELVVLSAAEDCDRLAAYILNHTTTIGLRRSTWQRWELPRREIIVPWDTHEIPCKAVLVPNGQWRVKAESDVLITCAEAAGLPIAELKREVESLARLQLEQQ